MTVPEILSPEKRGQIMAGAAVVFARDGYEGASMSRIAAEAGVSKGTLYNYFVSKAALFSAYVSEECDRNLSRVFDHAHDHEEPGVALREIARRMITIMLSPTGLTINRVVVSEAAKFPELARGFFEAGPARATRYMADWLIEETRRKRLHVTDPEFVAEQFFALCQTRLVLRRRLMMLDEPSEMEIDRVVEAAVTMFLNTYAAGDDAVAIPARRKPCAA